MKSNGKGIRRWKQYSGYKDSGVEWLGQVPKHWSAAPLYARYIVQLGKMLDAKRITGEHLAPYVRNVDVQWDRINVEDLPEMDFTPADRERFSLRRGDLLVCEGGEVGRAAIWSGELAECYYQKAIHRLRPLGQHDLPRFFRYVLFMAAQMGVFVAEGNQNTIDHLTAEKLRKHRFPFPPLNEQEAVVSFLDRETAKIDPLISKKERLLELLQEKRTALISRAVTKGLNLRVPMKDSGVEWLGKIPSHWEVIQSKRVFRVRNEPAAETDEQLTASQKYGMLPQEKFIELEGRRVVATLKGTESLRHVEPNDFVISLRSFQGGIEWCGLRGSVTFHYIVLRPVKPFHPAYFGYLFKSSVYIQALRSTTDFIRDGQDLRYSHFMLVPLPVVPLDEQIAIAAFLDQETARIDSLVKKVQSAIERLREYRTALISAVVTGKIDVREEVA